MGYKAPGIYLPAQTTIALEKFVEWYNFKLWRPLKAWNFRGNTWIINSDSLLLISALCTVPRATSATHQLCSRQTCMCSYSLHTTHRSQGKQKEPAVQISGICALVTDCWFWSQKGSKMAFVAPPFLVEKCPPFLAEVNWREPPYFLGLRHFYFLSILGATCWIVGHSIQLHMWKKSGSYSECVGDSADSEITWKDLMFKPEANPLNRNSLQ